MEKKISAEPWHSEWWISNATRDAFIKWGTDNNRPETAEQLGYIWDNHPNKPTPTKTKDKDPK